VLLSIEREGKQGSCEGGARKEARSIFSSLSL
jgi:hypothetical protein